MTGTGERAALIALDWGTSSLRTWLLDGRGRVMEARRAPRGIMADARFATVLHDMTGDWQARWPGIPALAAGMIGSANGWVEVPYHACPAGPDELAGALVPVPEGALRVVPGVARYGAAPNVMRGEETEIAGTLALRPGLRARARLVMPGTHSKWVEIADGRIVGFETYMTGEVFSVLRHHSILGRLAEEPAPAGPETDAAFLRGVEAVREGGCAAPLLFSARALALTGGLPAALTLDYLSGLLIGEELSSGLRGGAPPDALIGDAALCRLYGLALSAFGIGAVPVVADAAVAGLWRIARKAGLVTSQDTP